MKEISVFMLAGESSGDQLGAAILDGLDALGKPVRVFGIGGPAMKARGFITRHPMEELTIMGLGEAITSLPRLSRIADTLIEEILAERPDLVLTIDNKGFSLRFARRLRKRMRAVGWSRPIFHLVAPTVWAWGRWRAATVARSVDHLLCLFPFEMPYFTDLDLEVTCVGHPAADQVLPRRKAARSALGVAPKSPFLLLLPGSRKREIDALLPDMLAASRLARQEMPGLEVCIPAAETVRPRIDAMIGNDDKVMVIPGSQLPEALAAADFGLMCSGTVTLEAALAGLPGAVYYRGDALAHLVQPLLVARDRIVLPNAILGEEVYPLYLRNEFDGARMAATALAGLTAPEKGKASGAMSQRLMTEIKADAQGFGMAAARALVAAIRP